jgi:hypothetical protein
MERLSRGEKIDERQIFDLVDFVCGRYDCADFRMLCLLKTYIDYRQFLSAETAAAIKNAVLNFRYWMDEPECDGMCYWSENHQIIFHTCEYLAGRLFPDEVFTNNKMSGKEHASKAEVKILRWLDYRFLYGFTEWHSNTYYEEDIPPLSMLVDHAENGEIGHKAAAILDLLFLDMAAHSFKNRFVAASGRCYEAQKKDADVADVNDILENAFGSDSNYRYNYERLSAIFVLRHQYKVPEVIKTVAAAGPLTVKNSNGLNLSEIKNEFPNNKNFDDLGMYLWSMESFTNAESINVTMEIFNAWNLSDNNFLANLKTVNFKPLRKIGLLPLLVRILNPATQGIAIQRANTLTVRSDAYILSCAQQYHPGEFGDQQHIWQATLPNNVPIFSTHPGCPMFDDAARNFSPSYWVGNGINPHAAQDGNTLLCMYNLNSRKGFLEKNRQQYIHLYFPVSRMDEYKITEHALLAKSGKGMAALIAAQPFVKKEDDEYIIEGNLAHFACITESTDNMSFSEFAEKVLFYSISGDAKNMTLNTDKQYCICFKKGFYVNGKKIDTEYPRFDAPFCKAERKPTRIEIRYGGKKLILEPSKRIREETNE